MNEKAQLATRVLAAVIDSAIGWVVVAIPVLGGIVSTLYLLLKDGLMFQITNDLEWKNKSIGKKIMGIEVETEDGSTVDLAASARRNIPLAIGSVIAIIPVLGWVIGPLVAMILGIVEIVLVLTDPEGRRLGDRLAKTRVITSSKRIIDVE